MNDKKLLFPLLLFGIFFILIIITGLFQIAIIKRNIEGMLRSEGETLFKSVSREIEVSMEYLSLVEKSPSIITPNILNVMTYDEAIVDDIVGQLSGGPEHGLSQFPLKNMIVADKNGLQLERKGTMRVSKADMDLLVHKDQQAVIRMPSDVDRGLFMGMRLNERIVFFYLAEPDLQDLRKLYVMKTIVENEQKRLSITEINIYDDAGGLYLGSHERPKDVFSILKPLGSSYFPGFSMEILVSNRLAADTFRRTSSNFILLLFLLVLGGAGGISLIFRLDRKHAEREEKKEEYGRFLDIVRGEVLRVNRIVEDFLLSTKSGMPMERQNLHGIIEEVVTMLREKANGVDIRIENESDREVFLDCQRERFKQVLYNLVTNSMEAIGKDGAIRISGETDGPNTRIVLHDTGPGIRKDDLLNIFEYYYTTKDKGMGLGLPISYMIVKDHGGDMKVTSEEGKGTTFVITLPTGKGS
jgi:anti-sigma regulatory factor (Ser/Thr protein kinase)